MRVAKLRIERFRGIRSGEFVLHQKTAIVGSNGCGKSTIVDALSLVLGKPRMVRNLTEHDFTGSCPTPSDRFTIVATIIERFNRSDRTEVLNAHVFDSTTELQALTDTWLRIYNRERPHDSLGRKPPLTFLPRLSSAQSPNDLST